MTTPSISASPAFQLERHASGQLLLVVAPDGEQHLGVVPVRAFPIAAPDEGISLISSEGHELVWLERLSELPQLQRSLLQEELALRDFVPEITRLISVSSFGTPSTWTVETDRGDTSFVLKGEEDIRRLSRQSLLIAAGHGVHFSVKDMGALDRASRRLLERFL
ncbi:MULTISPECIES: DUF1854 domain-containing protein [unclassified Polaromonas]|jgi:hypothetical protein|uniref:cyanophycin metabolism-associated DUF1854 family protein n=1 Tax=unclassified Polaromonas TaxID=2638319 RepID=UPI0025F52BC0|nr:MULTISPECIES: DUF1854 domain-containing protein [unclassified Polaromonas]HQR99849.1 DUF1854 domain-containing protein [Polaromonas sp.]HQS41586.1 DUF1854 domain-containing protein [Polaromonas sp.]HQS88964.1 DUF1854 domain-containing protein [Polaromonas sp.]HQT09448.1 DUF1854 domain-containing protein [Polaromonas sp.]